VDAEGPWFDGVAHLNEKSPDDVFVAQAKLKKIGILGGGMSGLMSALLLNSVGIHDWKIIEASDRIGGRVHTAYLNGTTRNDYQYQEMGPMRFPVSLSLGNETVEINDHKMVFQLADVLNEMNGGNTSDYAVNFIKWIQSSPNTPASTSKRLPDGTVPRKSDLISDPSLADNITATYSNATAVTEAAQGFATWQNVTLDTLAAAAKNVFTAHKAAVNAGLLDFSEAGYIAYRLNTDLNITDQISALNDDHDSWYYDNVYFSASDWRTIDKGLTSLPRAFGPLVLNRTMFQTSVRKWKT
jgi:monoamine oxidase